MTRLDRCGDRYMDVWQPAMFEVKWLFILLHCYCISGLYRALVVVWLSGLDQCTDSRSDRASTGIRDICGFISNPHHLGI